MFNNSRISVLAKSAKRNHNAHGDVWEMANGNAYESAEGGEYHDAVGMAMPVSRPYVAPKAQATKQFALTITNSTASPIPVTLFNAQRTLYSATNGIPTGITITTDDVDQTYADILSASNAEPFTLSTLRLSCTNTAQIQQKIKFEDSSFGRGCYDSVNPSQYLYEGNQNFTLVTISPLAEVFKNTKSMKFNVLANTTVTLIFIISEQFKASNSLNGQSAVTKSVTPSFVPLTRISA